MLHHRCSKTALKIGPNEKEKYAKGTNKMERIWRLIESHKITLNQNRIEIKKTFIKRSRRDDSNKDIEMHISGLAWGCPLMKGWLKGSIPALRGRIILDNI